MVEMRHTSILHRMIDLGMSWEVRIDNCSWVMFTSVWNINPSFVYNQCMHGRDGPILKFCRYANIGFCWYANVANTADFGKLRFSAFQGVLVCQNRTRRSCILCQYFSIGILATFLLCRYRYCWYWKMCRYADISGTDTSISQSIMHGILQSRYF